MIEIALKKISDKELKNLQKDALNIENLQKNVLYKVDSSKKIPFVEEQAITNDRDVIWLDYKLNKNQYGIYAHEFRNPVTKKDGNKSADILACVIDSEKKKAVSLILDSKHNISAFSDNVRLENTALTAIKDVRDFCAQIKAEMLHKNSFMIYFKAEKYEEWERIGIATKNFEGNKFQAVADYISNVLDEDVMNNDLMKLKVKRNLMPYKNEISRLRLFAEKQVEINGKKYDLELHILREKDNQIYEVEIPVCLDC